MCFRIFLLRFRQRRWWRLLEPAGAANQPLLRWSNASTTPSTARCTLTEKNIAELNPHWLRQQIGYVGQEPVLFGESIRENLIHGLESTPTDAEIEAATRAVHAHDFIAALPQGYDTYVGERGVQLSGGQKQRLAIARALLRRPHILILDEATSALDVTTERLVQDSLQAAVSCTLVVIAHRLSTIQHADVICVLHRGVIVQQGKHAELLKQASGVYAQLLQAQVAEQSAASRLAAHDASMAATLALRRAMSMGALPMSAPEVKVGSDISLLRRVLFYPGTSRVALSIAAVGIFLSGTTMPVASALLSHILGEYFRTDTTDSEWRHAQRRVVTYCLFFLLTGFVIFTAMWLDYRFFAKYSEVMIARMRTDLFAGILRQHIGFFDQEDHTAPALLACLNGDVAQTRKGVYSFFYIFHNLFTLCGLLGMIFYYEWRLAWVMMMTTPVVVLTGFAQISMYAGFTSLSSASSLESTRRMGEALSSIRTVASLTAEDAAITRFSESLHIDSGTAIRRSQLAGFFYGLSQGGLFFSLALGIWYGGRLLVRGDIDQQAMLNVLIVTLFSSFELGQGIQLMMDGAEGKRAARRVFEIMEAPSQIDSLGTVGATSPACVGDLEIRHLHFSYPLRPDAPVFSGFWKLWLRPLIAAEQVCP
eukprot:TRINITY_DN4728_c0_g1_i6.p1 TRINITY_DN4728_c0_g1~~TRINITY_DN4728_c0_g1_i6.p1  ORF type:complete len:650 (+),score=123.39 TRINITY_DN4728_c0_g1_i6:224-2173(+)